MELKVKNGRIYSRDNGKITELAIVVKADDGKVLDCGDYDVMAMLCKWAMPINGWDMRVLHINQDNPDEAVRMVKELAGDPEKCLEFIRTYESEVTE